MVGLEGQVQVLTRLDTARVSIGRFQKLFLKKKNLVRLELVPVLTGLTYNWIFTYSQTISELGLVLSIFYARNLKA